MQPKIYLFSLFFCFCQLVYGQNFCSKATTTIQCESTVSGSTSAPQTAVISNYDCTLGNFAGRERVYRFVLPQTRNVTITLTIDLPGIDLDLFLRAQQRFVPLKRE
jgi:hypothetical protein